jgi:hypothetical protein
VNFTLFVVVHVVSSRGIDDAFVPIPGLQISISRGWKSDMHGISILLSNERKIRNLHFDRGSTCALQLQ